MVQPQTRQTPVSRFAKMRRYSRVPFEICLLMFVAFIGFVQDLLLQAEKGRVLDGAPGEKIVYHLGDVISMENVSGLMAFFLMGAKFI
jgi:hypothetical protein